MSADSVSGARHRELGELIPWLVNGRLSAAVAAELNAHLAQCGACARDYAEQLRIHAAMQPDDAIAFASEASFQKLASRLDAPADAVRVSPALRRYAAALVVAALGLAAWGGWSAHRALPSVAASYRTLTSPAPLGGAGAQLRVVFTPDLTLSELGRLLHSIDANITDGPTEAGVYTLGFGPRPSSSIQLAQRLAVLRASDSVRFAEPVTSAP